MEQGGSLEALSVLLYADDMVLMSNDRGELATMLQVMDRVSAGMGLRIYASKIEIMTIKRKPKKGSVEVEREAEEVVIGEGVGGVEGGVTVKVPGQCACS